ncbi:hypothetical protein PYW08_006471 [Mythimna loreyi]|uniref:Uncharacterized protein n=1 Tax=Mythimna loreyi TaxID=667449 RepID=A0ACC2QPU7_9NEOP|nr:hypothetical protein PYW08_006471 [Mythimna loreyi]
MVLSRYGIEPQQLYSITSDNGANMLAMSRQIEEEIQDSLEDLNNTEEQVEESDIIFSSADGQEMLDLVESLEFERENIAQPTVTAMPRINISPKPKRKRQQWDPENMKLAVQAVQTMAMGYKKAVKMFSVPRTTLRRLAKCTGESIDSVVNRPLGRKCVLPPEIEKELVAYLLFM